MNPTAEIINIGDELLIGQVINTNAAYLSTSLNSIGIDVQKITVISDKKTAITNALTAALQQNDLVLITGGLGPTNDDITKHVLCTFFETSLIFSPEAFSDIEKLFSARKFSMTEVNRQQAFLPENCISIANTRGTARGMWFNHNGKIIISMPGVPFEMTEMMEQTVVGKIKEHFMSDLVILHRTIMFTGIGESALAEKIADWETHLPECLSLAYLPSPGIVRLRLTGKNADEQYLQGVIDQEAEKLKIIVSEYIFAEKDTTLEAFIIETLTKKGLTVSTAESCTGGYLSHLLTSISGSSGCFKGGIVSYSNEVKRSDLNISDEILEFYGAVSESVVQKMAENIRLKMKTDFGISTSGIAGPGGGVEGKPVGTVWIAVSSAKGTQSTCCHFGNDRIRNIQRSAMAALDLLRKEIEKFS